MMHVPGRTTRGTKTWAVFAAVVCVAALAPAWAGTIYVKPGGDDASDGQSWETAKKTVTAGLAAAVSGDEVWVAAGTYVERITLKKDVALYGGFAGTETQRTDRDWNTHITILDGNAGGTVVVVPSMSPPSGASSTRIDGFTIRNGKSSSNGGGIVSYSNLTVTISNNLITGNVLTNGLGGGIFASANAVIHNNRIVGNSAGSGSGGGIYCPYTGSSGNLQVFNNVIAGNDAKTGGGIRCEASSKAVVLNNTIIGNNAQNGGGIFFFGSTATVANNIVAMNSSGLYRTGETGVPNLRSNCVYNPAGADYTSLSAGIDDILVDPQIVAAQYGEVHLKAGSPCIDAGLDSVVQAGWVDMDGEARIQGDPVARVDIGADEYNGTPPGAFVPRVIRVQPSGDDAQDGSSWGLAKATVQAGIDAVASAGGGEVWVAGGTYNQRITLGRWVHVYGGFAATEDSRDLRDWVANSTILDGGAGGPVVQASSIGYGSSTIDGFVIRNGDNNGSYSGGGGVHCNSCSPVIAHNTITGNTGNGIGCTYSSATIADNTITANTKNGIHGSYANLTISSNTITANTNTGVYGENTSLKITGNTITGNGTASTGGGIRCMGTSGTVIANNTITGNDGLQLGDGGGGIYCTGDLTTIVNNTITGNGAPSGGGIYCAGPSTMVVSNNRIQDNWAPIQGGGLYCGTNSTCMIANNTITGNIGRGGGGVAIRGTPVLINNTIMANAADSGGGIYSDGGPATIANNTIVANGAGRAGGVLCFSSSPALSNNIVAFNSSGIERYTAGTPVLRNNCVHNPGGYDYSGLNPGEGDITVDPELEGVKFGQVHLRTDSPCIDAGYDAVVQADWVDMDGQQRIQGTHVDMGVDEFSGTAPGFVPRIVRVSPTGDDVYDGSSWELAKRTVQAGVDAAANAGGEVWVAEGVYEERITLALWAHLYGGFAASESSRDERNWVSHETILDGEAAGTVVEVAPGYYVSGIDGFTIRNGGETVGAGLRCGYAWLAIANNIFIGNAASSQGGAVYCARCSPVISGCTFIQNSADCGGAIYCYMASPVFSRCTILGNTARTQGGGIYAGSSSPVVTNCTFSGNSAPTGGAICVITTNTSAPSSPVATNCTFSGNSAAAGAGLYNQLSYGLPNLVNCIIWGNDGPAITNADNGVCALTYCDVQGGWSGVGNMDSEPRFVRGPSAGGDGLWGTADDDYGDLRLLAGSPCIDAGNNAAVPADVLTDLSGLARFLDDPATGDCLIAPGTCGTAPIVDMGAYEFMAGDYDRDGDVDRGDLTAFLACVSGPTVAYVGDCSAADADRDGDVDMRDFGVFQRSFTGEKVPGR